MGIWSRTWSVDDGRLLGLLALRATVYIAVRLAIRQSIKKVISGFQDNTGVKRGTETEE